MKTRYKEVIDFYNNSTPKQHQYFLELISDKITLFNAETKECFKFDEEYIISFNGTQHQINIK
jgi:hypothetical protein